MDDSAHSENSSGENNELVPREPSIEDLVELCQKLNESKCQYLVIGGFAIISAGYLRRTMDIDLIIDTSPENEAKAFRALESLPDQAVKELDPGDVEKYTVVRIADEIIIDLMQSASGMNYTEASKEIIIREVQGVSIPFASPRLLWKMKATTHRAKDEADLVFLREFFKARGEEPPT